MVIGSVAGGIVWWLDARLYESTDDAFIQADASRVSSRVSGHILEMSATDNQLVEAGYVIAKLDPRDLQAKVSEAKASLAAAQAGLEQATQSAASSQANVGQARAAEEASRTEADRAHNELKRFQQLSGTGVHTTADHHLVKAAADSASDQRTRLLLQQKDRVVRS